MNPRLLFGTPNPRAAPQIEPQTTYHTKRAARARSEQRLLLSKRPRKPRRLRLATHPSRFTHKMPLLPQPNCQRASEHDPTTAGPRSLPVRQGVRSPIPPVTRRAHPLSHSTAKPLPQPRTMNIPGHSPLVKGQNSQSPQPCSPDPIPHPHPLLGLRPATAFAIISAPAHTASHSTNPHEEKPAQ
jgi:hypothetical protein